MGALTSTHTCFSTTKPLARVAVRVWQRVPALDALMEIALAVVLFGSIVRDWKASFLTVGLPNGLDLEICINPGPSDSMSCKPAIG